MEDLLKKDQDRKKKVVDLLNEAANFYNSFEDSESKSKSETFLKLKDDTANGKFSITVVGEFSAGKSTFLNSLMRGYYLPSFQKETTATINFLRSVKESPTGKPMIRVNYFSGEQLEDYNVDLKTITKYVSTQGDNVSKKIRSVDVYLDSPFLNDGVSLVDSPGLNGIAEGHEDITNRQIKESHAAIYMFSCPQPGSKSDFKVLKNLTKECNSIFIVLNRIDMIKSTEGESVESVIDKLKESYQIEFPDTKVPEIWPISSYLALAARCKCDIDLYNKLQHTDEEKAQYEKKSRFSEFEDRLLRFLTLGEKNKKALVEPLERVDNNLESTYSSLIGEINILSSDNANEEISNQIESLQSEISKIDDRIKNGRTVLKSKIKEILRNAEKSIKSETSDIKEKYITKVGSSSSELEDLQDDAQRYLRIANNEYIEVYHRVVSDIEDSFKSLMLSEFSEIANTIEDSLGPDKFDNSLSLDVYKLDTSMFESNIDIDRFISQQEKIYDQIDAINDQIDDADSEYYRIMQQQKKYERLIQKKNDLINEQANQLASLGTRPEARTIQNTTYESRWKWWLIIPSRIHVPVTKTTIDTTELEAWEKETQKVRDSYEQQISDITVELNQLSPDSDEIELKRRQLERKQNNLKAELERVVSDRDESIRSQKKQYEKKAKRYLEDSFDLFETQGRDAMISQLKNQNDIMVEIAEFFIKTSLEEVLIANQNKMTELQKQLTASHDEREKNIELKKRQAETAMYLRKKASDLLDEMSAIQIDTIKME